MQGYNVDWPDSERRTGMELLVSPLRYLLRRDIILIGATILLDSLGISSLTFEAYDTRPLAKHYYWLANTISQALLMASQSEQ